MSKDYGQFCGLAKAARVLGERWALLVVRDLAQGPARFNELHDGLPGIPTTVLTTRLRELEAHGVVERRPATAPARGVVYALTPYGQDLQPVLDALGRWGARRMLLPSPDDTITDASLASALHAAYQPGVVRHETTYLVRSGPATAWAITQGHHVETGIGQPPTTPDHTLEAGPQLRALLAGRVAAEQVLADGDVALDGSLEDLELFARAFHVPLDPDVSEETSTTTP